MKLQSTNFAGRTHEFNLTIRDRELILARPDGREIANLTVCTAEGPDGNPTDAYWICFNPVVAQCDKNLADVF